MELSISIILAGASLLLGLSEPPTAIPSPKRPAKETLSNVLTRRLSAFQDFTLGWPNSITSTSSDLQIEIELKKLTAEGCVYLLQLLDALIRKETAASTSKLDKVEVPVFGVKDMKIINTCAGIIGRWGIALRVYDGVLPSTYREVDKKQIEEIEEEELQGLDLVVQRVLRIIELGRESRNSGKGQLVQLVLPQLLIPLLGALVQLGYEKLNEGEIYRISLQTLFQSNTLATVIASLLLLLSSASASNSWLRPALGNLLSDQILRPRGVRSLLMVVVGNEEEIGLTKLESLSKLLGTKHRDMDIKIYLAAIIPQLIDVIQSASPPNPASLGKSSKPLLPPPPISITRAACFVFSHLIDRYGEILESIVWDKFFSSFVPSRSMRQRQDATIDPEALDPIIVSTTNLFDSLSFLSTLIQHSPPSPNLLPFLFDPIIPTLFSLLSYLRLNKVDPLMLEEVKAILEIWGKTLPVQDAMRLVSMAIEAVESGIEFGSTVEETGKLYWGRSDEGSACIRLRDQIGDLVEMELKLDTEGVVAFLQEVGRADLNSALFLRWLDQVQSLRADGDFMAAKRSVMRLQLILKMVDEFGSEILKEPREIITFVGQTLSIGEVVEEILDPITPLESVKKNGIGLMDLKIVEIEEQVDVDVEAPDEPILPGLGADEMIMTALTLLLAVLELDPLLTMATAPLLALIYDKLEGLASNETSELIPPLAKEARMILALRKASSIVTPLSSTKVKVKDVLQDSRETYQTALKLLQDQILPVRAQGLALLRSLISSKSALLSTDPALLPAILDIFIFALEDDDSFLYLNAIQGLEALIDCYGKPMVQRLMQVYLGGKIENLTNIGEGEKGRKELDKRLRIAESLNQIVQRAGDAFAVFVHEIVPLLLIVFRTSALPTPLRSSSLTILATAIETAPFSMIPYVTLLLQGCLDLLSLESRPLQPKSSKVTLISATQQEQDSEEEGEGELIAPQLDRNGRLKLPEETPIPTANDSRHPAFRRAAILFLAMLFRAATNLEEGSSTAGYDSQNALPSFSLGIRPVSTGREELVSREQRRKTKILLKYLEETDEDSLVRYQAGEVLSDF